MAALKLTAAHRRLALLLLCAGSFMGAERLFGRDDGEPAATESEPATVRRAPAAAPAASVPILRLDRLQARLQSTGAAPEVVSPFETRSWQPPPAAVKPAPTPPPVAPPFPYPYLGGLTDDGVRTGFFTKGERVLPLRAGDSVDGAWRVEQMTETQMTLTYLPLNLPVGVPLGGPR